MREESTRISAIKYFFFSLCLALSKGVKIYLAFPSSFLRCTRVFLPRALKNNLIKTQPPGHHSPHPYTPSPVCIEEEKGEREREKKNLQPNILFQSPIHPPEPAPLSRASIFCTGMYCSTTRHLSTGVLLDEPRGLPAFIFGSLSPSTWRSHICYIFWRDAASRWHVAIYLHAPDV